MIDCMGYLKIFMVLAEGGSVSIDDDPLLEKYFS